MAERFEFNVKSSSVGIGYHVVVLLGGADVSCVCDCQAGVFGKMCKHKLAVMSGDKTILLNTEQAPALMSLASRIGTGPVGEAVSDFIDAESAVELAKKRVAAVRKKLEKMIR